jgi:hypothetical protein
VKILFHAIAIAAVALSSATGAVASPADRAEGAPQSAWDCASACNDCESDCARMPAGAPRAGCVRTCESSAARCCTGYGKKPPGTDCYCQ